jgi:hypothetical protein
MFTPGIPACNIDQEQAYAKDRHRSRFDDKDRQTNAQCSQKFQSPVNLPRKADTKILNQIPQNNAKSMPDSILFRPGILEESRQNKVDDLGDLENLCEKVGKLKSKLRDIIQK